MEASVQLHDPADLLRRKSSRNRFVGSWAGPKGRLACCGGDKNLLPLQGIEPGSSAVQSVTRRYAD
jgi:hypothetical protein